ncbi:hypothetical protein VNO77_23088 [Canavalia gladiata]|uniref:Uncharacterized protein n=1 Tax=Canavalia gladiata TaxID=3824 RepID=A0AAN9L3V0_CANGL
MNSGSGYIEERTFGSTQGLQASYYLTWATLHAQLGYAYHSLTQPHRIRWGVTPELRSSCNRLCMTYCMLPN